MRRRFAARSAKPTLVCGLGLLLGAVAILLLPTLALAVVSGDGAGCLCQSPQPPGDSLAVVAFLDVAHGWLAAGPMLLAAGSCSEAVATGALIPQGCAWTAASVGRPPPLSA